MSDPAKPPVKIEIFKPFINSTLKVLGTMAQTTATAGAPSIKHGNKTWGVVTGLIGLAGEDVSGNLIISFDKESILSIVSKMLMEEFTEVSNDVADAVGEITNMICGDARVQLTESGYKINMARPMIISGKDTEMHQVGSSPTVSVPFKMDKGEFVIEVSLERK